MKEETKYMTMIPVNSSNLFHHMLFLFLVLFVPICQCTTYPWAAIVDRQEDQELKPEKQQELNLPNYVWPLLTNDRNYFVIIALRQLCAVAYETKAYKMVEPFISQNRLAPTGLPIGEFLSFAEYEKGYPSYINRKDWDKQQGRGKGISIYFEVKQLPAMKDMSCKMPADWDYCVQFKETDYETSPGKKERVPYFLVEHIVGSHIGHESWASIFKYIRSHWLLKNLGYKPDAAITLMIVDGIWYHSYVQAGLLGIGNEDILKYPRILIGGYISAVAKKALELTGNPTVAVGWRIQRQFCPEWGKKHIPGGHEAKEINHLIKNRERGGFVLGCQTDFLLRHMSQFKGQVMVLMFDIFAGDGFGADVGAGYGPTQLLRRNVAQSMKDFSSKSVVFVHEQKKNMNFLNQIDPKQYHLDHEDREVLLAWLEIAAGALVPSFVNAGGHFADAITILRDGKGVIMIPEAKHCLSEYEEWTNDDDLLGEEIDPKKMKKE